MRFATILLCTVACVSSASAGELGKYADRAEVRIGGAFYDVGFLTQHNYDGGVINGEFLFASPAFLNAIGSPRPYIGTDIGIADDPIHFFYGGLTWDYHLTEKLYLSLSGGGAIHTADDLEAPTDTRALGSQVLFHVSLGVGYDFTPNLTAQVYMNHFSNAGLTSPNDGHDSTGVRLGYRF